MATKVVVDRVKCTGLGICEAQSPNHFEIDDDGELLVLKEDVSPDELEELRDTVAACPTGALLLVED